MRSGTSFFNKAIYRKTVNRFWPLWAVNLVIWLFLLPLNGLMNLSANAEVSTTNLLRFARNLGDYAGEFGLWFALFAGLITAMAVCSHMYNNRSANFMGALPVRREGQFVSTYLAGLTILVGPNLLVALLTLIVEAAGNSVVWFPLLYWLLSLSLMEFFFFSFAVCLGQFTGHILALPAYYAVFNAIVMVAYALLNWVLGEFYFGFYTMTGGAAIAHLFTPVAALNSVSLGWDRMEETGALVFHVYGEQYLVIYALAALALAVCALLLHRRRHLETAGDAVAVRAMRPVFKYGVAACAGLCLGYVTSMMLNFETTGLMASILVWGLIGYFVAQMILDKTVRVFKKWKGAVAVVLAFLLLFAAVGFDVFGFEDRVPKAEDVESVQLYGLGTHYYYDDGERLGGEIFDDPEIIADVIALHKAIVYYGPEGEEDATASLEFRVDYTLKSGGELVRRYYSIPAGEHLLSLGQAIWEHYEVRWKAYSMDYLQDLIDIGATLEGVGMYTEETYFDNVVYADVLWAAVMEDFVAGRIGIHEVGSDWYQDYEEEPLRLEFKWVYRGYDGYDAYSITFSIPEGALSTRAELEKLWAEGILGDPGWLK